MATYPVNTQWTWVFAAPWFHDILIPPAPPAPGPGLDLPSTQQWALTIPTGFTKTVMHQMQLVCLEGHNVGMMVPHITMPASSMLAILIPLSERKMMFSASTVKLEGKPAAVAAFPFPSMMDCGDPAGNPLTVFPVNYSNTMIVGMTFMDALFGVLGVVIDIGVDLVFEAIDKKGVKKMLSHYGRLPKSHLKKGAKQLSEAASDGAAKTAGRALRAILRDRKHMGEKAANAFLPHKSQNIRKWAWKTGLSNAADNTRAAADPATEEKYGVRAGIGRSDVAQAEVSFGIAGGKPAEQGAGAKANARAPWSDEPSIYDTRAPATQRSSEAPGGNAPSVASNPPPENLTPSR